MNRFSFTSLIVVLFALSIAPIANAQTMSQAGSGVRAFFGSQSGAYIDSDPFVGSYTSGPSTTGPYPIYTPLPGGVPTPPPATPQTYPGPYLGYNFQVAGGSSSGFADLNPPIGTADTNAKSVIADSFLASPSVTTDAQITIPYWRFQQNNGAPGWAWEQLNFAADYTVSGGTLGASGLTAPIWVSGNTSASGTPFVQFDGVVTYSFDSINTAGILSGTPVVLGSLNYSFIATSSGPFGPTAVFPVGTIAATPAVAGVLELTGHFWVAGDPFEINISSNLSNVVPEPTSIGSLIVVSGMALVRRSRRK